MPALSASCLALLCPPWVLHLHRMEPDPDIIKTVKTTCSSFSQEDFAYLRSVPRCLYVGKMAQTVFALENLKSYCDKCYCQQSHSDLLDYNTCLSTWVAGTIKVEIIKPSVLLTVALSHLLKHIFISHKH